MNKNEKGSTNEKETDKTLATKQSLKVCKTLHLDRPNES